MAVPQKVHRHKKSSVLSLAVFDNRLQNTGFFFKYFSRAESDASNENTKKASGCVLYCNHMSLKVRPNIVSSKLHSAAETHLAEN